jgi:alpha-tubulin suppressor-like RCC1 family protein
MGNLELKWNRNYPMKQLRQPSHKKSRLSIVMTIAMVGLFGLTTGSALADSNESSSSSSTSYIQSSISAGGNSTCVVLDGAAKCWGANESGQLGNGSKEASFSPVTVTGLSSGVTAISVGNNHACAVVSGGVKCWGANESGQLGNGSTINSLTPVSVSGLSSGVTAVSVGGNTYSYNNRSSNYSCAVVSGGVKCWGANGSGQLGNGSTTNSPTPVSVSGLTSGVTAVSVGGSSSYSSDSVHACAVVSGAAKCWGDNGAGQLGNSSTIASQTPVSVTGLTAGVTAISVGGGAGYMGGNSSFSCAVVSGAAKCWGANSYGQLGNATSGYSAISNSPVAVSGASSGVTAISTGDSHACAIDSGAVKCWGMNGNGQVGNGSKSYSAISTPVSVSGVSSGVSAISLGYSHSCAVTATALKCWGSNSSGQSGPSGFAVTQVTGLTSGVTALSSAINGNASHVCAIQSGGLKCWGHNMFGQLGEGTQSDANTPQQVIGLTSGVTAIHGFTCAVVSGAAKCWGNNIYYRLGSLSSTPATVQSFSSGVTAISGHLSPCVVVDGAAKCWGANFYGQLGNGTSSYSASSSPVQVVGLSSDVTAISSSEMETCAIHAGAAKCWGYSPYGEVGNGSTTQVTSPAQVTGLTSGVTAISVGSYHVCAIVSGAAKCWGNNGSGQLGNGTNTNSSSPVQVTGLDSGVTAIAAGENITCAVANGALKCWGSNGSGLLGNGLSESSTTPVSVLGMSSGVSAVTLSRGIACAAKNGAAKCWGDNTYGLLGNGTTGANDYFNFTTPQEVEGIGPLTTTTTTTTIATPGSPSASTTTSSVAQGQASVATIPKSNGSTTTTLAVAGGTPVNTTSTTIVVPSTTIPVPDAPQVEVGEAAAMVDGKSVAVSVSRNENRVTARVAGISVTISGLTPESEVVSLDSDGNLRLDTKDQLVVDASGYLEGQEVSVWMYSTPSRLGVVTADATGNVSGIFDLPAGINSGDHRVVLDGDNENGQPVIIGLGIAVGSVDSSSLASRLLIIIPVLLAIFAGLFIPAAARRRRREEAA